MRRALSVGVVLFVFAVWGVGAQELSVSYVEGEAQVRSGASWVALSIVDRLSTQATIQLSRGAYLELKWVDSRISLSPGPARNRSGAAGARGAYEGKAKDSEWVTSSAQVFMDASMQYLKSGQYEEAIQEFLQALDAATEKESPQVQYNLACAYSLSGSSRAALKHAAGLRPSSTDELTLDFIILKANLLVDSNAFAQEIAWLTQNGNDLSGEAQWASIYNLLLGVGYRGIGDTSSEKASLSKVGAISGESDLAKPAAQLLQNPQGG